MLCLCLRNRGEGGAEGEALQRQSDRNRGELREDPGGPQQGHFPSSQRDLSPEYGADAAEGQRLSHPAGGHAVSDEGVQRRAARSDDRVA